jgi:phosphoribosyl-dephospho-CoA transferase
MQLSATPGVHSLLQIRSPSVLQWEAAPPAWAIESLRRAPFVVVRRATHIPLSYPVGVRGASRSQRVAAWLPKHAMEECISPQMLARARAWRRASDWSLTPAIASLEAVDAILGASGLAGAWGPTGSAGFELASCTPATHLESDLDLTIDAPAALSANVLAKLQQALSALRVRIDLQLEVPQGAVLFSEVMNGARPIMLRSARGPRLVNDPWHSGNARI